MEHGEINVATKLDEWVASDERKQRRENLKVAVSFYDCMMKVFLLEPGKIAEAESESEVRGKNLQ